MEYAVEMKGIDKSFNGIKVNDHVDFNLSQGEIHCLLGENGAGKTTLMNILYGLYTMERGEILVNGSLVRIKSPLDAIGLGIGMVHQHFKLVDTLSVYENIVLGNEETKCGFLLRDKSVKKIREIAENCRFEFELNAQISTLPIGVRQRVEIVKALYRGAKVLILDEPTAVLTPQEVDEMFVTLKSLRNQGTSIIFITHKMRETFAISDKVTVMRKGKVVATLATCETNTNELANLMVGHTIADVKLPPRKAQEGEVPVLSIQNLEFSKKEGVSLKEINLDIYPGEIVGIAGVDGNGQTQLVDVLAGVEHPTSGQIILDGKNVTNWSPRKLIEAGVALIPDDRHRLAMIPQLSVTQNLILGKQRSNPISRRGLIRWRTLGEYIDGLMNEYNIFPRDPNLIIKDLSGGNQQKVIIARELSTPNLRLVIAFQPTRGLDIGAIDFVQTQLIRMREEGAAILLVSAELSEVRTLSDRIAVIYEGRLAVQRPASEFTEAQLGLLMAGASE